MKIFPRFCTLLALTCLAAFPGRVCAAGAKPNIILIMADDFGYECVTVNGGQSYRTPVLDQLAATGVRFEHCHVQPLCTPTRAQLMTGRYNVRNYLNFGTLPRTETTFGNLLKSAGYATGICGKWQLGSETDSPQHFGFEESCLWQQTRRPRATPTPGSNTTASSAISARANMARRWSTISRSISSRATARLRSFSIIR